MSAMMTARRFGDRRPARASDRASRGGAAIEPVVDHQGNARMQVHTSPAEHADEVHIRPPLSRDDLGDLLRIAMRAGQLMLENGANTAHVEETVHHIGTALGAQWLDVYVTPSGIIASAISHGEHRTLTQRVVKSGIELSRFAAVIEVSRRAAAGDLGRADVRAALERIAVQPRWPTALGWPRWRLAGRLSRRSSWPAL
jgi:hypothetical protein